MRNRTGVPWDAYLFFRGQGCSPGASRDYARAEAKAKAVGGEFHWFDDWDLCGSHVDEYPDAYDEEPMTCEYVTMTIDGVVVGSLGCVDDATDAYRRLTEAALADEWLAGLPKVTDAEIYTLRLLDVFGPLVARSGRVWTGDGADFSPSVISPSDLAALPA